MNSVTEMLSSNGFEEVKLNPNNESKDLYNNFREKIQEHNNITLSDNSFSELKKYLFSEDLSVADEFNRVRSNYVDVDGNKLKFLSRDNNIFQYSILDGNVYILINGIPFIRINFDDFKTHNRFFRYAKFDISKDDVDFDVLAKNNLIDALVYGQFIFNNELITLRPYQLKAVLAFVDQYLKSKNGYAWHCSASGNSISSFRLANIFKNFETVDKVVLVVNNTDSTFFNYNVAKNRERFLKQFPKKDLIVTYDSIIKNNFKSLDEFKDKNIIFIIDDCSRLINSKYMGQIMDFFSNSHFYAFVSAPKFNENSIHGRTTKYNFDEKVSQYILKDAIADGNLVEIDVDFFDGENLGDIKNIRKLLSFPKRISQISKWVADHHYEKTDGGKFKAIFMAYSASSALRYYDFLKIDTDLKVAVILDKFKDATNIMSVDEIKEFLTKNVFRDYNRIFNTDFSLNTLTKYKEDVYRRLKNGEIDILITTANNKKIDIPAVNTLYLDHNQLINSLNLLSDVDRPFDNKKLSNIVVFSNLEDKLNRLLKTYSNENPNENSDLKSYSHYVAQANKLIKNIKDLMDDEGNIDFNEEDVLKIFLPAHGKLKGIFGTLKGFKQYKDSDLDMDEKTLNHYYKLYKQNRRDNSGPDEKITDFNLVKCGHVRIDVDYLNSLNFDKAFSDNSESNVKDILTDGDFEEPLLVCPLCHRVYSRGTLCSHCGSRLADLNKFLSFNKNFTKSCDNCNIIYNYSSSYCYECGEPLNYNPNLILRYKIKKCPNCRDKYCDGNYDYCMNCGFRL